MYIKSKRKNVPCVLTSYGLEPLAILVIRPSPTVWRVHRDLDTGRQSHVNVSKHVTLKCQNPASPMRAPTRMCLIWTPQSFATVVDRKWSPYPGFQEIKLSRPVIIARLPVWSGWSYRHYLLGQTKTERLEYTECLVIDRKKETTNNQHHEQYKI